MPGTLTVGCRHPNGIIMRLYAMVDVDQQVMGGGVRSVKEARALIDKGEVKLNGCARFVGKDMPHDIRGGAGLTYGVDADFYAEWARQNPDLVRNKVVFAHAKPNETTAEAKDVRPVKTGFEPIQPNALPDEFKGKVQTAAAA